jgi:hypothetical protein
VCDVRPNSTALMICSLIERHQDAAGLICRQP